MASKELVSTIPAVPEIGKRYVTISEALERYKVSDRTITRYIDEKKILPVVRDRFGHVKIELEILDRVMRERNIPPNQLYLQIQDQQKRIEALEHEIKRLREQMELMTRWEHAQGHFLEVITKVTEPFNVQAAATLKHLLAEVLAESGPPRTTSTKATGLTAMLEKRGLPPNGTMQLVDFFREHQSSMTLHEIKEAYKAGTITLTVYPRPGEHKRNKQEWWITLEQHRALVSYWQQQGITYTACPLCKQDEVSQAG